MRRGVVCEILSHHFSPLSDSFFFLALFSSVCAYCTYTYSVHMYNIYTHTHTGRRAHVKFCTPFENPSKRDEKENNPRVCVPAIPYSEQIARQIESTSSGKSVELFSRLEKAWTKCWRRLLIQYTPRALSGHPGPVLPKLLKIKIVMSLPLYTSSCNECVYMGWDTDEHINNITLQSANHRVENYSESGNNILKSFRG